MNRAHFYILFILLILAPFIGKNKSTTNGANTNKSRDLVPSAVKDDVVQVLQSDASTLVFQVKVPPFTRITKGHGEFRDQINIPDFSQSAEPGKPQVPVKGFPFGIPENAEPTFTVIDKEVETFSNFYIHPAPTMVKKEKQPPKDEPFLTPEFDVTYELIKDQATYNTNRFYPEEIVRLNESAYLRDQRLQAVRVFPIQYNPVTKEIRYVKNITIQVNYNASLKKPQGAVMDDAESFEKLYQRTLLNYSEAKQFRKRRQASLRKPAQDGYFLNEGNEWYKIFVEKDAIYWMERADLAAAGLDVDTIDPRYIKMFNKGQEIDIHVHGQADGSFDTGDYIEFYGTAFKNYYTDTNVYWLTVSDTQGSRMAVKDGTPSGTAPILTRGKERVHFEVDKYRVSNLPNSVNEDRWYWGVVNTPGMWGQTFYLPSVSDTLTSECFFELQVKGLTGTNANPDHHLVVTIAPAADTSNKNVILDDFFDGKTQRTWQVNFDQSYLQTANFLQVYGPGDTGALTDRVVTNYFKIGYWEDYTAIDDSIGFASLQTGTAELRIKQFSVNSPLVFDISDTLSPQIIDNFDVNSNSTTYTLSFEDNLAGDSRFVALKPEKRVKPDSIVMDAPSDLRATSNQADYIMITFEDFEPATQSFATYKNDQGYTVDVVRVQNIYDEFNYGFSSDIPIRDYLKYTYNNRALPKPSFVLLVGDASYNPRLVSPSIYGADRSNFVPTHHFESSTYNFETASDNWYVAIAGDDILPDIYIGRITSRTNEQSKSVMQKSRQYEIDSISADWQRTSVFVADNSEQGLPFEANSDSLIINKMPQYFDNKKVYMSEMTTSEAKDLLIQYFNEGALIMNYQGHGSTYNWASEIVFHKDDVPGLRNDNRLPVVVTEACTNGNFFEPKESSSCLGEVLLNERNRGASAVFTGSGFSYLTPDQTLANSFYQTMFIENQTTLGVPVFTSLIDMYIAHNQHWDHVYFYTLFGDPSLQVKYSPLSSLTSATYSGTVTSEASPLPENTDIVAYSDEMYLSQTKLNGQGKFDSLVINKDNPRTSARIEGAAPGDTIRFVAVLNETDTLALVPKIVFKPGMTRELQLSVSATHVNEKEPQIEFYVNDAKVGESFYSGDVIALNSLITTKVSTPMTVSEIELSLNDRLLDQHEFEHTVQRGGQTHNISFVPAHLKDDVYNFAIKTIVEEIAEPQYKEFSFSVQSDLNIVDVLNYPNPLTDHTAFTFVLQNDRSANVKIKIYTVSGRLIRELESRECNVGYNEIAWDGSDENGEVLANGVYLYRVIAKDEEEKHSSLQKLIVAR